jgi:hypothetical protein
MTDSGRVFLLRLRSLRPDDETIRNLRWLLKIALRQWGFRCVEISEVRNEGARKDERCKLPPL